MSPNLCTKVLARFAKRNCPYNINMFMCRAIQKNFVDMENMFDLLHCEPEVIDAPGAPPLTVSGGHVEFRNVVFSYVPERLVLRNINFVVPPGKTVALVSYIHNLCLKYFFLEVCKPQILKSSRV